MIKIMKITIYELLGLIKDGKAPAKIKYVNSIYELSPEDDDYYSEDKMMWFTHELNCLTILNDEVEIIEEDKKIEKIEIEKDENKQNYFIRNEYGTKCYLTKHSKIIASKINELIDEVNKLKEK